MFKSTALLISSFAFTGVAAQASILYENALPNINLNQPAGNARSNVAFSESDPVDFFDGTSVTFSPTLLGGSSVIISSITNWSVASVLGQPLGDEFDSVYLMYRPVGGTWQVALDQNGNPETGTPNQFFDSVNPNLVNDSNPDITHTQVPYTAKVADYESLTTAGSYFPLWQNTFTNLSLQLATGVPYEFSVWGASSDADPNSEYGYWFNAYSSPSFFLSGAREDDKTGTYLRCDATQLSNPCFVEDPFTDQTWDKRADFDIMINGIAAPEPGTFLLSGLTILLAFVIYRTRSLRKVSALSPNQTRNC